MVKRNAILFSKQIVETNLDCSQKYFRNCLQPCIGTAKKSELVGEMGIVVAAKGIVRDYGIGKKTIERRRKVGI